MAAIAGTNGAPAWRRRLIVLVALLGFAMLYPRQFYARLKSPNELARAYLVVAIAERGSFSVDDEVRRWGSHVDLSRHEGHWYSNKAPGGAFVAVPVYAAMAAVYRLAGHERPPLADATSLCAAITVVLPLLALTAALAVAIRARGVPDDLALAAAALAGAGTILLPYGTTFFAHGTSAAALGGALLLVTSAPQPGQSGQPGSNGRMAAAGALAGIAGLCEYTLIPAAVLFLLHVLWRRGWRTAAIFTAGALPAAAALLVYDAICFGSPFSVSSFHESAPQFAALADQGLVGITHPRLAALYGLTLSPSRGLFFWSPFLLLAFAGWWHAMRGNRGSAERDRDLDEALLTIAAALPLLLLIASYRNWHAGAAAVGPRYLAASIPAWAMAAALALRHAPQSAPLRIAVAVLGSLSLFAVGFSTATFPFLPHIEGDWLYNPLASVSLPLALEGLTVNTWGHRFGWPRAAAALPLVFALCGIWALAIPPLFVPLRRRTIAAAGALAAFLLLVSVWLTVGSADSPARERERATATWFAGVPAK